MSTNSQPETSSTTEKMLASIRRGTTMPVERLAGLSNGTAQPVPETKPAETAVEKPKKPVKKSVPTSKTNPAEVSRNIDFAVNTGKGIKHLTIRVPKEMAADLALLAMRNKLSENGEPTTINELGIKAFETMLADAA